MTLKDITAGIAAKGLAMRGCIRITADDRHGALADKQSLVLLGLVGRLGWDTFTLSPEAQDMQPHPLDRWSERMVGALAEQFGASAIYPFGGPPFWPFQRWAQRAEPLYPSPLGLLIHPEHGLWHSYRGALAFAEELALPKRIDAPSPCKTCTGKPCLSACPVGAFGHEGYDSGSCADWLRGAAGSDCMEQGCLARRACPVGAEFTHRPDQARFGMKAFLAARD